MEKANTEIEALLLAAEKQQHKWCIWGIEGFRELQQLQSGETVRPVLICRSQNEERKMTMQAQKAKSCKNTEEKFLVLLLTSQKFEAQAPTTTRSGTSGYAHAGADRCPCRSAAVITVSPRRRRSAPQRPEIGQSREDADRSRKMANPGIDNDRHKAFYWGATSRPIYA